MSFNVVAINPIYQLIQQKNSNGTVSSPITMQQFRLQLPKKHELKSKKL